MHQFLFVFYLSKSNPFRIYYPFFNFNKKSTGGNLIFRRIKVWFRDSRSDYEPERKKRLSHEICYKGQCSFVPCNWKLFKWLKNCWKIETKMRFVMSRTVVVPCRILYCTALRFIYVRQRGASANVYCDGLSMGLPCWERSKTYLVQCCYTFWRTLYGSRRGSSATVKNRNV